MSEETSLLPIHKSATNSSAVLKGGCGCVAVCAVVALL